MTRIIKLYFSFFIFLFLFSSCSNSKEDALNRDKKIQDSLLKIADENKVTLGNPQAAEEKEGIVGVFEIPEMLCISILDSCNQQSYATKMGKNFSLLETELKNIQAEVDGSPGSIFYNDDAKNFKFECIFLIKEMPPVEPKVGKIVVLEASNMVIYNYFGMYQNLINGYNAIRTYCKKNNLIQSGPMRQFYVTDPLQEQNYNKWLTRIMVPVDRKK